jgi:NDP-sugar pyrophosphorylase family protein
MPLQCVILAGGRGTRMRPLTDTVPKAMIPVLGAPFAGWQLSWLASHGVKKATFSIGYRGGMIRDYIGDGSRWELPVDYVDEGENLRGTGGALRLALDQELLEESFFLLYGDSFLPIDMRAVEAAWDAVSEPAMMTVLRNTNEWDLSNVVFRDGRVVLYDKRRPADHATEMRWIDYGLSILTRNLIEDRLQPGAVADIADLLHDVSISGELAGLEVDERFYEVGSAAGLHDLEQYLGRLSQWTGEPKHGRPLAP